MLGISPTNTCLIDHKENDPWEARTKPETILARIRLETYSLIIFLTITSVLVTILMM
jgi:hypothetical protein